MEQGEQAPAKQHETFWRAVALCLTKFHSYWPEQAAEAVGAYRRSLPGLMTNPDLIYEEDPFYLACAISDDDLPVMEYREDYAAILREAGLNTS